ncbi:hypothetical protein FANTH_2917 [Fusarium anthophilum]|uniref:Uncharacterized protein n=1 Tax=Fusarium anthophilum TaxID=48485 RepID=A0A8H4ZSR4_9HYPO|nr:hypothetical protein FANTH_2917 [Fusarium anthophilum]
MFRAVQLSAAQRTALNARSSKLHQLRAPQSFNVRHQIIKISDINGCPLRHGAIVNDESSGTVSSISCSIAGARASTTASRNGTVFKLIRDISVPNSNWAAIADTPQRYDHRFLRSVLPQKQALVPGPADCVLAKCKMPLSELEVSNRIPIQAPDTPDSTNDTDVSDPSPTPRPVAEGSQPVNTQAPESDDIDAGPVEATSDLR